MQIQTKWILVMLEFCEVYHAQFSEGNTLPKHSLDRPLHRLIS